LTLESVNDIDIQAPITAGSGGLTLNAGNDIRIAADISAALLAFEATNSNPLDGPAISGTGRLEASDITLHAIGGDVSYDGAIDARGIFVLADTSGTGAFGNITLNGPLTSA